MLEYNIQLNADGVTRFKATVPAKESGIVGDYANGTPFQPDKGDDGLIYL